jgi:hypothetical protein
MPSKLPEEVAMIDRRQLFTVGGLLGALGASGADVAASGTGQVSPQAAQDLVNALRDIRATIAAEESFAEILPVRSRQVDFLKSQGRFPDFIDVATDVWFAVHDWHVRLQQPLVLGRDAAGRYTLMLGFTALVLRPDVVPGFISTPYDNR